jgi:hypothetical protein
MAEHVQFVTDHIVDLIGNSKLYWDVIVKHVVQFVSA